jgi:hypothetical protein
MKMFATLSFLLTLLTFPALAGVVFEIETTDHEQSPPQAETIQSYVAGKNIKIGIPPGHRSSGGEMIYRGDHREMMVIDHDEQSYMVMDEEAMQEIVGQVSGAMAQVQEALKNVPEAQRAMVEKMMKERMPTAVDPTAGPTSELRRTSQRETKNGYPCVKYDVLLNGKVTHALWVTPWSKIEGGDEAREAFLELSKFFKSMMESFSKASGFPGLTGQNGMNLYSHFTEIDGFPVVTQEFGVDGSLEDESVLRSSKRQTIDPSAFEPPAGYKRRSMMPTR